MTNYGELMVGITWENSLAARACDGFGSILVDADFVISEVTAGVLDVGRYTESDLVGRSALDLVHVDDLARAAEVIDECSVTPGERSDGMYRLRLGDGSGYQQFAIRANNLGPRHENSILFEFSEPTNQMRAEAFADDAVDVVGMLAENLSLEDSFEWVARVAERHVEGLQIVITLFEEDGGNQVISRQRIPAVISATNRTSSPTNLPQHVEAAQVEAAARLWRSSRKIASLDYAVPGRLTSILQDVRGSTVGFVEVLRKSSQPPDDFEWLVHSMISRMLNAVFHRHEFDRQLRDAAEFDFLTGLVNRRKLFSILDANVHLGGAHVYVIDLDDFSSINNSLGHQAGDDALVCVARKLRATCSPEAVIARLGGDEFVVFMPEPRNDDVVTLGERLRSALAMTTAAGQRRGQLGASIGMVVVQETETAADALARADAAMYSSKRAGGNAITVG